MKDVGCIAGSEQQVAAPEVSPNPRRQQSFQLATAAPKRACKKAEAAAAIAAFAADFHPGQKAVVAADGLPKLTQLLTSASPAVQDSALSALLVRSAS